MRPKNILNVKNRKELRLRFIENFSNEKECRVCRRYGCNDKSR